MQQKWVMPATSAGRRRRAQSRDTTSGHTRPAFAEPRPCHWSTWRVPQSDMRNPVGRARTRGLELARSRQARRPCQRQHPTVCTGTLVPSTCGCSSRSPGRRRPSRFSLLAQRHHVPRRAAGDRRAASQADAITLRLTSADGGARSLAARSPRGPDPPPAGRIALIGDRTGGDDPLQAGAARPDPRRVGRVSGTPAAGVARAHARMQRPPAVEPESRGYS